MSTATATEAPPPAPKGKKKLIIIIAAALAVLALAGGGAAFYVMKKNAAAAAAAAAGDGEAEANGHPAPKAEAKHESKGAPIFVPLDPFTVNLADRDAERYAQVGITLEIEDSKVGDQLKTYMPAIRNNILMAIADRTAGELLGREGKAMLAERIMREASRGMGVAVEDDPDDAATPAGDDAERKPVKKKKKKPAQDLPVKAVHFSNFIIQ